MGIADRDYARRNPNAAGNLTPVVKALLIINVAVYLLDILVFDHALLNAGAFRSPGTDVDSRWWQFLSFQFLHGSVGHILMNSVGLYMFGRLVEPWWGSRRFLIFYLLCGVGGAAFYTLLVNLGWLAAQPMVGASAGIYGALIATAVIAPHGRVQLLFPPINMAMRTFALFVLGLAVLFVLTNWNNNDGGEAGHLGGAIVGFLLMRFPQLLGRSQASAFGRAVRPPAEAKLRPRTTVDLTTESEIDRILDKVSAEGLHSLTEQERETLNQAANKKS